MSPPTTHIYEVRLRKDKRGVDLISDGWRLVGCGMANQKEQDRSSPVDNTQTPSDKVRISPPNSFRSRPPICRRSA